MRESLATGMALVLEVLLKSVQPHALPQAAAGTWDPSGGSAA